MAPRSQMIKQLRRQVRPSSKNVSSTCSIVFSRFSWKVTPSSSLRSVNLMPPLQKKKQQHM